MPPQETRQEASQEAGGEDNHSWGMGQGTGGEDNPPHLAGQEAGAEDEPPQVARQEASQEAGRKDESRQDTSSDRETLQEAKGKGMLSQVTTPTGAFWLAGPLLTGTWGSQSSAGPLPTGER